MIKNIEKKIEFFMTEAKRRDFIVSRNPWAIKVEKEIVLYSVLLLMI